MSNENTNLSDKHQTVLNELRDHDASSTTLAEVLDVAPTTAKDKIHDLRAYGYEISYNHTTDKYVLNTESAETVEVDEPGDVPNGLIDDLRESGLTYGEFHDQYGLSESQAGRVMDEMRAQGYDIEFKEVDQQGTRRYYIPEDGSNFYQAGDGDGTYTFALISDTHLGSSAEHLTELHDFYDRLVDRGIDTVFHCGDISDGWKVHKGHVNVIKGEASGWSRLKEYVIQNYPEREGVDTFFIEGNHDHKFHRRTGLHFGKQISQARDDLHYCGDSMARFVFDAEHDIDLELIHPSGGKPYTVGYRLQTLFRERSYDNKPTIAGVGHLHGSMYAETEGVHGFYAGAWKGTTTYGKRKGHEAKIGGWILELEIEDGEVRRLSQEWVGYEPRDSSGSYELSELDEMRE